jgi:predicted nucleic acid-binding Zn ribbon protein
MLREYQLDGRLKDFQVRAIWQRLMEKELGNYISEVRVREGVLYVKVLSSPLRQELTIAREEIREQLNAEMGEPYVREVVIR